MFIPHDHHVIVQPDASLRLRYTPTSGRREGVSPAHSITPGAVSGETLARRPQETTGPLCSMHPPNSNSRRDSDVPAPGTSTT